MTEEKTTTEKFEPTHIFATGGSITLARLKWTSSMEICPTLNVYLDRPEWDNDGYIGRIYVQEMDMRERPPTKAHKFTPLEYKTRHYYFAPYNNGEGMNYWTPCNIYPLESESAKKLLDSLQENEASLIWPKINFETENRSNEWWGY
mgnify:CR=1 FL=1